VAEAVILPQESIWLVV